jgi:5-methylcytosine-specific restriction protein A
MPDAPHQQCRHPRCPNYAVRYGCCIEHVPTSSVQPTYNGLNSSNKRFRRLRHSYLLRHPFCIECGAVGCVVDHRIPHRGDATLFWSQSNWQTLCLSCHGRKTATETLNVVAPSKQPWRNRTPQGGGRSRAEFRGPGIFSAPLPDVASRPAPRYVERSRHVGGSFVLRPRGGDRPPGSDRRHVAPPGPQGDGKNLTPFAGNECAVDFLRPRIGNRGE